MTNDKSPMTESGRERAGHRRAGNAACLCVLVSLWLNPASQRACASATPADSVCDRAAYFLFNRHLNRTWLDSAYSLLASVRSSAPKHERCLYLWSRVHTQKGDDASGNKAKLGYYGRAKTIAETLQTVNPRNADGHMWWGVAQGRIGQTRGVLNSLFMVPGLKRAFNRVLDLDPKYTTACDALGVLYYELPGIAGGNLAKSEEYLTKGIAIDPDYTVLRLDLAKVYVKQKRWAQAREQLNRLLATTKPTYPADFAFDDKPEAQELLGQISNK